MSQNDRTQLIPDPQQPSRPTGGVQSPRPITPTHSTKHGSGNTSQRQNPHAYQQRQSNKATKHAPSHTQNHHKGPRRSENHANGKKSGAKMTLFVALGLIVVVYIVGVVAFSQVAYPNTTIAGVDVSFSNASSAATKVNSAWKHYKLTVAGDDFNWTYQPESDEPIVDGEAAAKEIISRNEAFIWPVRLVESLSGKTKTIATSNEVDLEQDVDLSMLSDTFDQKKFEEDLGAAIDEFNEGRSGTFEANSSYDEQAGKFTVEKARSNEKLNREHVIKYAELELASLAETVDLSKLGNDAYEPLNETLTNDQIQAACDAANNFLGVNVTLKLNGEDAGKVDGSSVLQWISFADPANPTLDTSQISSWAAELANSFNTVGTTRWWTRADGKECAVEGGDFGWSVDSDALAKQVEDAINNKQTGEIEIKYSQKSDTYTAKGEPDWRRISTSTCPSSTRATMTRTVISYGRPTLSRANRERMPPPRAFGRSIAMTAQASSSVPKTQRPENQNTKAPCHIGCRLKATWLVSMMQHGKTIRALTTQIRTNGAAATVASTCVWPMPRHSTTASASAYAWSCTRRETRLRTTGN